MHIKELGSKDFFVKSSLERLSHQERLEGLMQVLLEVFQDLEEEEKKMESK